MRSAVRLMSHLPRIREAGRIMKDEHFVTENSQWDFSKPLSLRRRNIPLPFPCRGFRNPVICPFRIKKGCVIFTVSHVCELMKFFYPSKLRAGSARLLLQE